MCSGDYHTYLVSALAVIIEQADELLPTVNIYQQTTSRNSSRRISCFGNIIFSGLMDVNPLCRSPPIIIRWILETQIDDVIIETFAAFAGNSIYANIQKNLQAYPTIRNDYRRRCAASFV